MTARAPGQGPGTAPPDLWDPVVRLSHWAIVVVVLMNAVLTEGGSTLHVAAGWVGMAVLALRLVWGFLGPREARFAAFPPRPLAALRHLGLLARGRPPEYPTHNPAGAAMAYALWFLLVVVTATGLVMTDGATPMQVAADREAVASGDWSALVRPEGGTAPAGDDEAGEGDEEGEGEGEGGLVGEVHEVAANLILLLALVHVAGVVVESRAMRRNLLAPMLLGRRRRGGDGRG